MIGVNGKELTNSEFYGVYQDRFNSIVKSTFDVNDILLFVTYQPDAHTLDYNKVAEHTHQLFKQFPYLEVLEQNFKYNRLYDYGEYIDGYHSHCIIRESDYNSLPKHQVKGLDIVAKVVWDLDRLINKYLSKQAGQTRNRLLPTSHIPELITNIIKVFKKVHSIFQSGFITGLFPKSIKKINKIDLIHMFVDDT